MEVVDEDAGVEKRRDCEAEGRVEGDRSEDAERAVEERVVEGGGRSPAGDCEATRTQEGLRRPRRVVARSAGERRSAW